MHGFLASFVLIAATFGPAQIAALPIDAKRNLPTIGGFAVSGHAGPAAGGSVTNVAAGLGWNAGNIVNVESSMSALTDITTPSV